MNNKKKLQELYAAGKQACWENNHDDIKRIKAEINESWAQEEKYWHQRSRVKWLKEGDANTAFSYHSTIARRRQNIIVRIKDNNGQWYSGDYETRLVF